MERQFGQVPQRTSRASLPCKKMEDCLRPQRPHEDACQFQQGSLTPGHLWHVSSASATFLLIFVRCSSRPPPRRSVGPNTEHSLFPCFRARVHPHAHTIYRQKWLLELADFIEDFGQKESGLYNRNSNHFSLTFRCHKPFAMPCQWTHLFLIYTLPSSPVFVFFFLSFYCSKFQMQSSLMPFVFCLLPTLADVVILFNSISL